MTFPLGNIRSFFGYEEPKEESNVTENTSLVSAVAETTLTNSTSSSQTLPSTSTLTSSAFVSDAGEAAAAVVSMAFAALDTSLEDIYVDMSSFKNDRASQTEGLTCVELLKELYEDREDYEIENRVRSASCGAELFARSSILTEPSRVSMNCLDDISLFENMETTSLEAAATTTPSSSLLRTQLFGFFIDLVKQDLLCDNISGGRVKTFLDLISGGMSREAYKELLDLIKEGDFTSTKDIIKFCNIIMSTPTFQSSQQLQILFTFFKGEGGAITLVLLQELMGVLQGAFGLPIPEGLDAFLLAIKNLHEATHPGGDSNVATAVSIVSIVSGVLQSETTRRVMQSCYDGCADSCAGNCGCAGCGCADGAVGCGGFGSLLCGLFAGCFNLDTRRGGITEEDFRKLEQKYSSAVVLVALNNLGINTVDLLSGKRVAMPSLDQVKVACESASKNLNKIIKGKSREMWGEAASNYADILSRPVLKEGIISGLSNQYIAIHDNKLRAKVMIDCSWGSYGFISNNEPFDSDRLVSSLVSLQVMRAGDKVQRKLGATEASSVMMHVSRILSAATATGDNIWLSTEDLMTLVCIVLAHKNLSVVDGEGSENTRIHDAEEIKNLFATIENHRVQIERGKQGDIRASLNASVLYSHIARNASKRDNRYKPLRDRAKTEVRDNLVIKMSMPWLMAAGLVFKSPSAQGNDEVDYPVVTRNSRGINIAGGYRETAV
ncbi:hypothetical protein O1W69_04090 [Chlamydia sp. 12-01]|uniref:hypothetical protein n=1 Tax=Chlamydia sp. 12-01 TaxID=3002742 RepID=UPI0035D4D9FD